MIESDNDLSEYIRQKINDFKKSIKNDEICFWGKDELNPKKHRMIDARFYTFHPHKSNIKDLGIVELIKGSVSFEYSDVNIDNLKIIDGYVDFSNSKYENTGGIEIISSAVSTGEIKSLSKLEIVGGNINFSKNCEDVGNLKYIGGSAVFDKNKKIVSLKNILKIFGNLSLIESKVSNLGRLNYIGGDAEFSHSQIKNLKNLTIVEGDAVFFDSKVQNLGNLTKINGRIYANAKSLNNNQIDEHLYKMNKSHIIPNKILYLKNNVAYQLPQSPISKNNFKIVYADRELTFTKEGNIYFSEL